MTTPDPTPGADVALLREAADRAPAVLPAPLGEAAARWLTAEADCHASADEVGEAAAVLTDTLAGDPLGTTGFRVVVSTLPSAVAFARAILAVSSPEGDGGLREPTTRQLTDKGRAGALYEEAFADAANAVFEALGGYPSPDIVSFPQAIEAVRVLRSERDALAADMRIRYHALADALGLPHDEDQVRGYYAAVDRADVLRSEASHLDGSNGALLARVTELVAQVQARDAEIERLRAVSRPIPDDAAPLVSQWLLDHAGNYADYHESRPAADSLIAFVREHLALSAPSVSTLPADAVDRIAACLAGYRPGDVTEVEQAQAGQVYALIQSWGATPAVSQAPVEPTGDGHCGNTRPHDLHTWWSDPTLTPPELANHCPGLAAREDAAHPDDLPALLYGPARQWHTVPPGTTTCTCHGTDMVQPADTDTESTDDGYGEDARVEFHRVACSCPGGPVNAWIHSTGSYCGDAQYEQVVDAVREQVGRGGDERDEEAVAAVLDHLAAGYTNAQIAAYRHISVSTVSYRLNCIHTRLHTQTRAQAVYVATRLGLLEGVPTP